MVLPFLGWAKIMSLLFKEQSKRGQEEVSGIVMWAYWTCKLFEGDNYLFYPYKNNGQKVSV